MTDVVETNGTRKRRPIRVILLLLALVTSPLSCCASVFLLDLLPSSLLPPTVDFIMNLFETEARVENRSGETLYITAITTTYGQPQVIAQPTFIKQHDIPLQPDDSIILTYDSADLPLSGIAVCRTNEDCRLLAVDNSDEYYLDSFENLPSLEPSWLSAIRSYPPNNFGIVLMPIYCLLPFVLFSIWLFLGSLENKRRG